VSENKKASAHRRRFQKREQKLSRAQHSPSAPHFLFLPAIRHSRASGNPCRRLETLKTWSRGSLSEPRQNRSTRATMSGFAALAPAYVGLTPRHDMNIHRKTNSGLKLRPLGRWELNHDLDAGVSATVLEGANPSKTRWIDRPACR
jgi:hypothetical protein